MSNRFKFIGQDTTTVFGGDLVINVNGILDPHVICSALVIEQEVQFAVEGAGVLNAANIGNASHEWLWRKTNLPFLNNISGRALDLYCQAQHLPSNINYNVLTPVAPVGPGTTYTFTYIIPLERPSAARPADFCVALDEIGTLTIQTAGAGLFAGYTLASWTARAYAIGYDAKPGIYHAGSLARVDELPGPTGNDVELKCYGHKVRSLLEYTTDAGASPITGETSTRIQFDGVQKYDYRSLNGGDATYLAGKAWAQGERSNGAASSYASYYAAGANVSTLVAPWIVPTIKNKLTDYTQCNVMQVSYAARLAATVDARFVLETIYPDGTGSQLRDRIPGGESIVSPSAVAYRPAANGGSADSASVDQQAFMPVNVKI